MTFTGSFSGNISGFFSPAGGSGGGGGGVTLPVPGFQAWYDATKITGLADGASVSQWSDLSGNAYHLTQATPAQQPLYYKSTSAKLINGLPTVGFASAGVATPPNLVSPNWAVLLTKPATFCVAGRIDSGFAGFFDGKTVGHRMAFYNGSGVMIMYCNNTMDVNNFTPGTPYGWVLIYNSASSLGYVDITTQGGNPGDLSSDGLTIGSDYAQDPPGVPYAAVIGELLVYPFAFTEGQVLAQLLYFNNKWAV